MQITINSNEFEKLQNRIITIGSETQLGKINRKIILSGQEYGAKLAAKKAPRSKDHSKSGPKRGGGRQTPPGHAADNVKIGKVSKKGYRFSGNIGWEPEDDSPHFYEKFPIYGARNLREQKTFEPIKADVEQYIKRMTEAEYEAAIKEAIG
ncbi:MAG: hypothetical protein VB030_02860 [Eubacterium aggregans]|uniref:hypothetical protein n=1 Tax=Eubacterium aggregans TaxID=81409 RepID=UPI002B2115AD|nr:hypothetical protein [Eubacterium aggregans]MEA5073092.1 hypothetical protein [Eubacterium aggregans]